MSVNRHRPHLLVLPEDDANRQLANGFVTHFAVYARALEVEPPAGGWLHLLADFEQRLIPYLKKYPSGRVVLLLDFDDRPERRTECMARVPPDLADRVFVIATLDEPEALKRTTQRSLERLGGELAAGCLAADCGLWADEQLAHNRPELDRMAPTLQEVVFTPAGTAS